MMKVYKNGRFLNLNVGLLLMLLALTFGCARKEVALTQNDVQRQRSLELENSFRPNGLVTTEEKNVENLESEDLRSSEQLSAEVATPERILSAKEKNKIEKTERRVEKLKKMIEKKTIKMQSKVEKGKASGLSSNLKIGIILVLVGILIAILLGPISYAFYVIGVIAAVIGLIFLILGIMEM